MDFRQGDIYWVEIRPEHAVGSEQNKRRPWVIASRTELNHGRTVVAVPLTSKLNKKRPHCIVIPERYMVRDQGCTDRLSDSVALSDQIRTLDKTRLRQKIGHLSQTATIGLVETGLAYLFGISN